MAQQDTTSTQTTPNGGRSLAELLRILAILFAIMAIVAIAWRYIPRTEAPPASSGEAPVLAEINDATERGDFAEAITALEETQRSRTSSPDDKARAVLYSMGARRAQDPAQHADEIRDLKAAIVADGVSPPVQAQLILSLMAQVSTSGNDPAMYNLVFEGSPFSTYRTDDNRASLLNLAEWSYETSPSASGAIAIARWHSQPAAPQLDAAPISAADAAEAARYLSEADALAATESDSDPTYVLHGDYFSYRLWRAAILGWLAEAIGEPYQSQYRAEYDEFIAFANAHPAVLAREPMPFARYWYALRLVEDGDREAATRQLDALAEALAAPLEMNAPFNVYVRRQSTNRESGVWATIEVFAGLSPLFKQHIESVVGSSIQTRQP